MLAQDAAEILRTKWMAMTASIWIQCTLGGSYTFGIYSGSLKLTQSYDQPTLDTVSVFKDIGGNIGVLSGLVYTATTSNLRRRDVREGRGGPWVVIFIGAILCFTGYFLMWASVTGLIRQPPVPVTCLSMFIAAHSLTILNTANVVSSLENLADYGGTAVGIMKGFCWSKRSYVNSAVRNNMPWRSREFHSSTCSSTFTSLCLGDAFSQDI